MDKESQAASGVQTPLHRRIAENLSNQVSSGKLKPGERLPSERQIARQFSASRATVRTALQHLEQAGLISRRERRSAIVSIRRDITPYLRIACSSTRLTNLFRGLGEKQILPPRCQLQLTDLQQSGAVEQLMAQPATGADILICGLEYINFFRSRSDLYTPLGRQLFSEAQINSLLQEICSVGDNFVAVPLGVSPLVVYSNRRILQESQATKPQGPWDWDQLREMAQQLTHGGRYGFQFRPSFSHLAALMASRGGELYQADGRVAARSEVFEPTVRFIYELVHVHKVTPLLAKADQLNLFAEQRCAMALDGFELYHFYRDKLGDNLQISELPSSPSGRRVADGYALLVLPEQTNLQPVQDLLRKLLNSNTQKLIAQMAGGLPARGDLLNSGALEAMNVPRDAGQAFLQELQRCESVNLPASAEHKRAVENLFLELWLGLDNIESTCRRFKEL